MAAESLPLIPELPGALKGFCCCCLYCNKDPDLRGYRGQCLGTPVAEPRDYFRPDLSPGSSYFIKEPDVMEGASHPDSTDLRLSGSTACKYQQIPPCLKYIQ